MKTRWKVLLAVLAVFAFCSATLLLSAFSLDNYHYPNAQRIEGCGSTPHITRSTSFYSLEFSNCYEVAANIDAVNAWYRSAGWIAFGKGGGPNNLKIGPVCYFPRRLYFVNNEQGNVVNIEHSFDYSIGLCGKKGA